LRASSERGVTLVELLITVSIMTVVLGFVTREFVGLQNASTASSLRLQNLDEARVLMDAVSKDLRTAARLTSTLSPFDVTLPASGAAALAGWCTTSCTAPATGITNTEVWFYSNLTLTAGNPTPCPDIVHLYVDKTTSPWVLKEQSLGADAGGTPPNCVYSVAPTTRLVGKYVANPTTTPVFTYYYTDASGNPAAFLSTDTPLSAANRLLVNAISITLSVRQSTNFSVPYTTLINRVRLANVDYNPLPSP
jgi:prepilin-type N-terminal cleavage/methylation domain-containing protein